MDIKDKFAGVLCSALKVGSGNQTIQSKSIRMILERFYATNDQGSDKLSYVQTGDLNTNVSFDISEITNELQNKTVSKVDSFCL